MRAHARLQRHDVELRGTSGIRLTTTSTTDSEVIVQETKRQPAPSTHYQPDRSEIRLLSIDLDEQSHELSCSLEAIPLADAHPFYALSYVWGDPKDTACITLDGERISVRNSLYTFLHGLYRSMFKPMKVWVDFLCINQDDINERNAQVAMMGQIYRSADSVYAWLGPPTTDSDLVFDFIAETKALRSAGTSYGRIYDAGFAAIEALLDILKRPYWSRLWIIQEIVLAKRLWLFYGSRFISWDDLEFALAGYKPKSRGLNRRSSISQYTQLMRYLKESREMRTAVSLSELVHKFRSAGCQDPRDKIYGLLSLANEQSTRTVRIDYAKPLLQILLETYDVWAAEWVLEQDRTPGDTTGPSAYTASLFCHQIGLLCPQTHIEELHNDANLRQQVTAKVMLKGTYYTSFDIWHIATVSSTPAKVKPVYGNLSSLADTDAYLVSEISYGSSDKYITYTNAVPHPGNSIIHIGSMILITDKDTSINATVIGRGVAFPSSPAYLLPDPHHFSKTTFLPDSTFELLGAPQRQTGRSLSSTHTNSTALMRMNAAVLVELLRAQDLERQTGTWSPYQFGLQHQILDACRACRLSLGPRRSNHARQEIRSRSCRCEWMGGSHPLSELMRKARYIET